MYLSCLARSLPMVGVGVLPTGILWMVLRRIIQLLR